MIYFFAAEPSLILRWMRNKGETGTLYDCCMNYFGNLSRLSEGTFNDHLTDVMHQLGYTGTLRVMLHNFWKDQTTKTHPRDAETEFWMGLDNDFTIPGAGDNILLEDGENMLAEDGTELILE